MAIAAYEPRVLTRFEMQNYARQAYELGVRYIGGCCGTEPYHIRAISEELAAERQKSAPVTDEFGDILSGIRDHPRPPPETTGHILQLYYLYIERPI